MNTNALAKQYAKLTPSERFPLIVAAAGRDDEAERSRLVQSAPRTGYSVPDYWGMANTFQSLSHLQFMRVLELAAGYYQAFGSVRTNGKKNDQNSGPMDYVLLLGYYLNANLEGWRQFCVELNIAPEIGWEVLPGFRLVKSAENLSADRPGEGLAGAAFVAEGVARYFARQAATDPEADVQGGTLQEFSPVTAQEIAADLRRTWEEQLRKWQ